MRGPRRRAHRLAGTVICAVLLGMPAAAGGQETGGTARVNRAPASEQASISSRRDNRLYIGMWTAHLKHDVLALDNNWLVGVAARGYFGATFLNSFGRRGFTGGIQRTIVASEPRPIGGSLGVRLGFITGYDGRLMRLARDTPVLPLIQPYATVDVQRIGIEVSYTFVVVSAAVSIGF